MIEDRYLLVMMIPTYVDDQGVRYAEELWHKDLLKHLDYIRNLTLAAPRRKLPTDGTRILPIDTTGKEGRLYYLDMPPCRSVLEALASLPIAAIRLWNAIGRSDIVHIGIGGWPISYGWVAGPISRLRRRFLFTNVESAGWRMGWKKPIRLKRLIQGIVFEILGRFCVNISNLVTFTHAGYLGDMLLPWRRDRGHVICASWIDEDFIISKGKAEMLWNRKLDDPSRPLRVAFIGNLLASKGLPILLDALSQLDERGVPVECQIYGKGEMKDTCVEVAKLLRRSVSLKMQGTLPYGPSFFEMLRGQDLVAVPSLSDEQPRIVFDCFSQAVPVVASATPGLIECVVDGRNAQLVPPGEVAALADAIAWAGENRQTLKRAGLAALEAAHLLTHDKMHARRAEIIATSLGKRRAPVH